MKVLSIAGFSMLLIAGTSLAGSADERPVFGESPTAIEQYFGSYWSRLTEVNQADHHVVTYTYSPGEIRSLFFDAENLRLSITVVNDEAELIRIHENGGSFNIPTEPNQPLDFPPLVFDRVFEYVFGDRPMTASPMDRRILNPGEAHGTLQTITYCISQGIAASYERISTADHIWFVEFFQEPACP